MKKKEIKRVSRKQEQKKKDKSFEEVAEHCLKERIKKLEKLLDDYRYIFTDGENWLKSI